MYVFYSSHTCNCTFLFFCPFDTTILFTEKYNTASVSLSILLFIPCLPKYKLIVILNLLFLLRSSGESRHPMAFKRVQQHLSKIMTFSEPFCSYTSLCNTVRLFTLKDYQWFTCLRLKEMKTNWSTCSWRSNAARTDLTVWHLSELLQPACLRNQLQTIFKQN
jgi:hypothetical protein